MESKLKDIFCVIGLSIVSIFLVWLPFLLHLPSFWGINLHESGLEIIKRNYDSLNYVIVAKSLYDPQLISAFPQSLPSTYFAAHFPLYPFLIRIIAPAFGYLNSTLLLTLVTTITAALAFYWLINELKITTNKLWLVTCFLLLPPRWLIVHSVPSPEPLFVTLVLLSSIFLIRAQRGNSLVNYTLAGIMGALAIFTRSAGLLVFIGFMMSEFYLAYQRSAEHKKSIFSSFRYASLWLLLIPLALLGVFQIYQVAYNDFFAYFHSGDNIHLVFPPFQAFNIDQYWIGTIWLEDIIFYFFFLATGTLLLWKKKLFPFASFVGVYTIAAMFIAHRDIARYTLPVFPFIMITYTDFLQSRIFKTSLVILALAIYLYAINFVANNTFPVTDLTPYL